MKVGSEGGPKEGHKRRIGVPGFGLPAWRPQRQEKLQGFKLHSEFTIENISRCKGHFKIFLIAETRHPGRSEARPVKFHLGCTM